MQDDELRAVEAVHRAFLKPEARLAAFQDGEVKTRGEEQYPDDFFGWAESV
jgi:hypothetical protein